MSGRDIPNSESITTSRTMASTSEVSDESYQGPRPLPNIGNTCYQNAVLQTLISISELNDFCHDPDLFDSLKEGSHSDWLEALIDLVRQYYFADDREFYESYRDYMAKIWNDTQFGYQNQEDCNELLTLIIDTLTDQYIGYPKYLVSKTHLYPEIHPFRAELNIKEGYSNFFAGTQGDPNDPRRMSMTTQHTHYLNLALPVMYQKSIITLTDLINNYKMLEVEHRKAKCRPGDVLHKLTHHVVLHLGKYIIIRLGREKYDHMSGLPSRNNSPVYMPYFYNFRDLLNQDTSHQETSPHGYSLISIIHHRGTYLGAGHYNADVFRDGHWYHTDDDLISPLSESEIGSLEESKTGYIYLYQRLDGLSTESVQEFEPFSVGVKYQDRHKLTYIRTEDDSPPPYPASGILDKDVSSDSSDSDGSEAKQDGDGTYPKIDDDVSVGVGVARRSEASLGPVSEASLGVGVGADDFSVIDDHDFDDSEVASDI